MSDGYSTRIDDTGTYQYFGKAYPGAATDKPVWQISRLSAANPQELLWADGDDKFDNVWDNRATIGFT